MEAEQPGTVMVSISDVALFPVALGSPSGPHRVRAASPVRFRLRLPAPQDVVLRVVPVSGSAAAAELVLDVETRRTTQSSRSGVANCRAVSDVRAVITMIGGARPSASWSPRA